MTRPTTEGLKSEALRAALDEALRGEPARLEALLARHGGLPGPKPNVKLAAAFGAELGPLPGVLAPLLKKLMDDEAGADTARAFLPIAAAHGWAHRVRADREVEPGWQALEELAADPRGPVRVGTLAALIDLCLREGGTDALVTRATHWLDTDDREVCFGAAALAIEVLADARVVGQVRDPEALLAYLEQAIAKVADAPRSAERSDGRRRVLTSLPGALAMAVAQVRSGERGLRWFEEACASASHPDVRHAFSQALLRLAQIPQAPTGAVIDGLRKALSDSAKPLRDPTRLRPGTGRGRRSRGTR